jgi:hypothetical protein
MEEDEGPGDDWLGKGSGVWWENVWICKGISEP